MGYIYMKLKLEGGKDAQMLSKFDSYVVRTCTIYTTTGLRVDPFLIIILLS